MDESSRLTSPTATAAPSSVLGRLRARNARRAGHVALVGNKACLHATLTYAELFQAVDEVGAGLLDLGLGPGDHVGLVAENCDLWLLSSLGITGIGAVDVPRGGDAPPDEIRFCLGHADCCAAIVESPRHAELLAPLREHIQHVIVLKGEPAPGDLAWSELLERGRAFIAREASVLKEAQDAVGPDDLCTIIYTSGTTGNPKGVMLAHRNLLHNIRVIPQVLPFQERGRFLSFLPSWHSFERTIEYIVLDHGMEIHYGSKVTLRDDLPRVKPTFLVGVPRIYEVFHRQVAERVRRQGGAAGVITRAALEASRVFQGALRRARGLEIDAAGRVVTAHPGHWIAAAFLGLVLGPAHLLARRLVYGRLRAALGGCLQAVVSGGGPLAAHVDEFMTRAGVPLLNGYGLTETSPVLAVRRLDRNPPGSIGTPLPETEIRIVGEDGRDLGPRAKGTIQARGPQVMLGYWRNEAATSHALPGDGWFDTGDLGLLSSRGDLLIAGRAKETIVLTGGENVEPEPLENRIITSHLIADALLVGHGQKSLGALVVPDFSAARDQLGLPRTTSDEELARHADLAALLKREIGEALSRRKGFRTFEQVARIAVLPRGFSAEDGTLTHSLKKRRAVIEQRHAELIASLFA